MDGLVLAILVAISCAMAWMIREMVMARKSFEQLKEAVDKAATVKDAAVVLIHDIRDMLTEMKQHAPTPAEIDQLIAHLTMHTDALAEAIADHEE